MAKTGKAPDYYRMVEIFLQISPFSLTEKTLEELSSEEWEVGAYFIIDEGLVGQVAAYRNVVQIFKDPNIGTSSMARNFQNLASAREDFWRYYRADEDYLMAGILLSGLRLAVVADKMGGKEDLVRPEYLLLAKVSADLSRHYFDRGIPSAARGMALFSARFAYEYLATLSSRNKLEDSYKKGHLQAMIGIVRNGENIGSDYVIRAKGTLNRAIKSYSPRGEQWHNLFFQ